MSSALASVALVVAALLGDSQRHVVRVHGVARDGTPLPVVREVATVVAPGGPVRPLPAAVEVWRPLVAQYSWPVEEALAVIECESRGSASAYNAASGASGLFQVVPYWHAWRLGPGESLFDPGVNVRVAWEIFVDAGGSWGPWVCR